MVTKKFKVRIKHFAYDKYEIQYSHYYLIPIYRSLHFWFEQSLTSDTQKWSTVLANYKTAEIIANRLKGIEDVREFYKEDEEREKDFYRRRKEYYDKMKPYETKYL